MFRIWTRFVVILAVVLLLTSCASSKRMMRLSPFASKNPKKLNYDESQVNLWPLFYNKGNFNSVLWPLIDSDSKGFAVRPMYNQDGKEYSILFPLCAWNPVNGDGWAFNTYWDKKRVGSVPLFHLGDKNKFNYILPLWWDDDWKSFGTLGASFSHDLNFIGPLWFDKSASSGGIFPIFAQGSKWGWMFPLYNYEKDQNDFYLNFVGGTLGRFGYDYNDYHYRLFNGFYVYKNGNDYQGFIPLYYYEREEDKKLFVTPLGGRGWDGKTGENSLVNILGPLYIKTQDKKQNEEFEAFCWPLYFNSKSKHEKSFGSFPLFFYKKGKNDGKLNILGPLYHHYYDGSDTSSYVVIWPLSFYSREKDETTFGSFPLFWYNKSKKSGLFNVLGLIWDYRWDNQGWEATSLLALGGMEHKYYDKNILPGKLHAWRDNNFERKKTQKRVLKEKITLGYLLFCENNNSKYIVWKSEFDQEELCRTSDSLLRLERFNRNVERYKMRLQKEKKHIAKAKKKLRRKIEIQQEEIKKLVVSLKKLKVPMLDLTDNKNITKIKSMIFEKYCTTATLKRISIPLLYTYNKFRGSSKWNLLLFLANGKKEKNYEKISILRYLYRYEKSGDVSSRIIFPFMSYKTAPKKSKFSFLWRVFSYKREDNNVSGHIFFIPF